MSPLAMVRLLKAWSCQRIKKLGTYYRDISEKNEKSGRDSASEARKTDSIAYICLAAVN
jgi:hypothetical protein